MSAAARFTRETPMIGARATSTPTTSSTVAPASSAVETHHSYDCGDAPDETHPASRTRPPVLGSRPEPPRSGEVHAQHRLEHLVAVHGEAAQQFLVPSVHGHPLVDRPSHQSTSRSRMHRPDRMNSDRKGERRTRCATMPTCRSLATALTWSRSRRRTRSTRPRRCASRSCIHRWSVRVRCRARRSVQRMLDHGAGQTIAMVAPPGYGKTTVLAQWSARQRNDVAWLSLDDSDNDPSSLLAAAAIAFGRVAGVDPPTVEAIASRSTSIPLAIDRLTAALGPARAVTLVLDHVENVASVESLDVIGDLAWRLPRGSQVAFASRSQLPIPTPVLRSRGLLMEIGPRELAMDELEASQLLAACGVALDRGDVGRIVEQTEGWPVGIYLAGLASQDRRFVADHGVAVSGNDVYVADYLRAEVLARLPAATVSFLTRTSILEQLSAPLCDAVLDIRGSQELLDELERANHLIVPLDRNRGWYRYHRLLRELLLADLSRHEPELVPLLHRRASMWFEANRLPETAIAHAQQAMDAGQVARLVATNVRPAFAAGRATAARRWLDWFRSQGLLDEYPEMAILGAWLEALWGNTAAAERWTALAEAGSTEGELPDGTPVAAGLAYLRMLRCRSGPDQMRADAQLAIGVAPRGQRIAAGAGPVRRFEPPDGGRPRRRRRGVHPDARRCRRHRRLSRGDGGVGGARPDRPRRSNGGTTPTSWLTRPSPSSTPTTSASTSHPGWRSPWPLAPRSAAETPRRRRSNALRAARLRPQYTYVLPVLAIVQLELAKAYAALGDAQGALAVLREMAGVVDHCPDLGVLPGQAEQPAIRP